MPAMRADRRGFTVAELLIVVAIIAVLVGVAIPVFNNQTERARGSSGWRGVPSANGTATVSYSLSTRQAIIKWGGEDHINKVSAGDFLTKETLLDVLKGNYGHIVVNSNESYAQGECSYSFVN